MQQQAMQSHFILTNASIYFIWRWSSSSSRIICGIGILLAIVYHIRFLLSGSCVCDGINRAGGRGFIPFFSSCLVIHREMRKTLCIRHIRILFFFFCRFILPHFWPGPGSVIRVRWLPGNRAEIWKHEQNRFSTYFHLQVCCYILPIVCPLKNSLFY